MRTPRTPQTNSGDLPLRDLRDHTTGVQPLQAAYSPARHRLHLANKTMAGFMDWWLNRVRGAWICNEQYDRIYDGFLNDFS